MVTNLNQSRRRAPGSGCVDFDVRQDKQTKDMWITQTYLGAVEPDAELYIYYFYANYVDDQKRFTKELQSHLEDLGDVFGGKVCLSMPNPRYAGRIEAEVRENRPLWEAVYCKLPGLLLSTRPLAEIEAYDSSCFFVSFESDMTPTGIEAAVSKIKSLADEAITWSYKDQNQKKDPSFIERFFDALELKLGVGGFKLDIRRLLRR